MYGLSSTKWAMRKKTESAKLSGMAGMKWLSKQDYNATVAQRLIEFRGKTERPPFVKPIGLSAETYRKYEERFSMPLYVIARVAFAYKVAVTEFLPSPVGRFQIPAQGVKPSSTSVVSSSVSGKQQGQDMYGNIVLDILEKAKQLPPEYRLRVAQIIADDTAASHSLEGSPPRP